MDTALCAFGTLSSEIAATSTPSIIAARVTISVPISPDPISPMRTGLPEEARAARSFANPVNAMLDAMRLFLSLKFAGNILNI
jgi:hypothetical protein